jgi:hypothetical protein
MRPGRKWNKTAALELAGLPCRTRPTLAHSSRCPVTRGQPTRLTDPTWRRMCQALRDPGNLACSQCHEGDNPPAELTIVTADQLTTTTTNKENDMSMYGECEICGEKKKIRSVRNKNACATCKHIWRAANVNPDLVLKTLAEAKGEDYLRQEVWPSPKSADQVTESDQVLNHIWANNNLEPGADIEAFVDNLVAESEWLKNRLDATKHIIATIRDQLDLDEGQPILEAVALLQRERQRATDIWFETLGILGADVTLDADNLPIVARNIMAVNHQLRQQVIDLEKIIDGDDFTASDLAKVAGTITPTTATPRAAILLDLALDVIAGRVSGLDAERIAALR